VYPNLDDEKDAIHLFRIDFDFVMAVDTSDCFNSVIGSKLVNPIEHL
jgi:hypothetical protein